MKLCISVQENIGLQASLQPHFPQAELLLIFDTESRQHHYIDINASEDIPEEQALIDAVLCGSINRHTLRSLIDQGIQVYGTAAETAIEAITQFENGELEAVTIAGRHGRGNCGNHDHSGEQHSDEAAGCCGGSKHNDPDHECCGGHGGDDDHECCGAGHGHGGDGCGCHGENGESRQQRRHAHRHGKGQCCGGHDHDQNVE